MTIGAFVDYSMVISWLQITALLRQCANFFHIVYPFEWLKFSVDLDAIWTFSTALDVLNPFSVIICQLVHPIERNLSYLSPNLPNMRREEEERDRIRGNPILSNHPNHPLPSLDLADLGETRPLFGPAFSSDDAGLGTLFPCLSRPPQYHSFVDRHFAPLNRSFINQSEKNSSHEINVKLTVHTIYCSVNLHVVEYLKVFLVLLSVYWSDLMNTKSEKNSSHEINVKLTVHTIYCSVNLHVVEYLKVFLVLLSDYLSILMNTKSEKNSSNEINVKLAVHTFIAPLIYMWLTILRSLVQSSLRWSLYSLRVFMLEFAS